MSYLEFLVYFYLKNHARVVKFSYLNFAPLNLYPTAGATVYCTAPARATVYPEWNAGGAGATTSRKFLDLQIPVDPWLNSLDSDYLVMGLLCISKNTNQSKKVLYCTSCGYCFLAQTFIFCLGL